MKNILKHSYDRLCASWSVLSPNERATLIDRFKVTCSYHSGRMENPEITYHDTAEVFDKDGVSNFTGDVRTIYEIGNLKHAWAWLEDALAAARPIDERALLDLHRVLTYGTYDETRWARGERPGTYKLGDYRVADDVGLEPGAVPTAVEEMLGEVRSALDAPGSARNALTIAAYAHAVLVDIHPFADGNGRTARLLMNYVLMRLGYPPCSVNAEDRLAYFGALDAFHDEGDLEPLKDFLRVQSIRGWETLGLRVDGGEERGEDGA